jgi:hypothetical protein
MARSRSCGGTWRPSHPPVTVCPRPPLHPVPAPVVNNLHRLPGSRDAANASRRRCSRPACS